MEGKYFPILEGRQHFYKGVTLPCLLLIYDKIPGEVNEFIQYFIWQIEEDLEFGEDLEMQLKIFLFADKININ